MKLRWKGETREVAARAEEASVNGRSVPLRVERDGGRIVGLEIAGAFFPARVARHSGSVWVWCRGGVYEFTNASGRTSAASEHAGDLLAPMPGRVRRTLVSAGDSVTKGQVVMVLEAMKMEHAIRAPRDGVVTRIAHGEGDLVEAGVALAELAEGPRS